MKKLKVILMSIVILTAVSGSLAAKKADFCEINQQYFRLAVLYLPAGLLGIDYTCIQTGGTCTYWRPNPAAQPNVFAPCKPGCYFPIDL